MQKRKASAFIKNIWNPEEHNGIWTASVAVVLSTKWRFEINRNSPEDKIKNNRDYSSEFEKYYVRKA